MSEKRQIVEKERITYEGLFSLKEVMDVINGWCRDKGYVPLDKKHLESVKQDGKYVDIDLMPFKKISDYAKNYINIKIIASGLKDVVVDVEGKRKKLNQGKLQIVLDGVLETDYEGRWEAKPVFYFIRFVFEKYVYTPFLSGFERTLRTDLFHLKNNLKGFLNLYQYYK